MPDKRSVGLKVMSLINTCPKHEIFTPELTDFTVSCESTKIKLTSSGILRETKDFFA